MGFVLLIVTLTLMFGIICHIVAEKKNRSKAKWLVLGLLFGPFALVALLVMGKPTNPVTKNQS